MALGDMLGAGDDAPPPAGGPGAAGGPAGRPGAGGPQLAALMRQTQAAQPTAPGAGNQADSMNQISMATKMLSAALGGLDATNPLFLAVTDALKRLGRHLAKGGPTLGTEQTGFMDMARQTKKNAMLQMIAQQQAQQGGRGGQPQQPGMPQMPLPGA